MKTLPELFAEVRRKVPGFSPDLRYSGDWILPIGDWGGYIGEPLASTIIVGACVAMLPSVFWWTDSRGVVVRKIGAGENQIAPTLAQALLLAVLAQHERSGT